MSNITTRVNGVLYLTNLTTLTIIHRKQERDPPNKSKVNKAEWFKISCKILSLKHYIHCRIKNLMERAIKYVKDGARYLITKYHVLNMNVINSITETS